MREAQQAVDKLYEEPSQERGMAEAQDIMISNKASSTVRSRLGIIMRKSES